MQKACEDPCHLLRLYMFDAVIATKHASPIAGYMSSQISPHCLFVSACFRFVVHPFTTFFKAVLAWLKDAFIV